MTEPIVSTAWLHANFENPELILLEAVLKDNQSNLKSDFEN